MLQHSSQQSQATGAAVSSDDSRLAALSQDPERRTTDCALLVSQGCKPVVIRLRQGIAEVLDRKQKYRRLVR